MAFVSEFSNPLVFSKSASRTSIILGISFREQFKHIHCNDSGYVKYFSWSGISFLHVMHFFILYGSVFFTIIRNQGNAFYAIKNKLYYFVVSLTLLTRLTTIITV